MDTLKAIVRVVFGLVCLVTPAMRISARASHTTLSSLWRILNGIWTRPEWTRWYLAAGSTCGGTRV